MKVAPTSSLRGFSERAESSTCAGLVSARWYMLKGLSYGVTVAPSVNAVVLSEAPVDRVTMRDIEHYRAITVGKRHVL
jgi:hypothetical protein